MYQSVRHVVVRSSDPLSHDELLILVSTNAGINILTDFAIVILPIPVIQGLNLCKRQKIALMSIFIIGGTYVIVFAFEVA